MRRLGVDVKPNKSIKQKLQKPVSLRLHFLGVQRLTPHIVSISQYDSTLTLDWYLSRSSSSARRKTDIASRACLLFFNGCFWSTSAFATPLSESPHFIVQANPSSPTIAPLPYLLSRSLSGVRSPDLHSTPASFHDDYIHVHALRTYSIISFTIAVFI
jgi:hypothetical protein